MSSSLKVVNIALVFWASWLSFLSCMIADMSSSLKVVNIALVFWASFSLLAIFILTLCSLLVPAISVVGSAGGILSTGAAPAAGALGGIGGGGGLAASGAAGLGGGGGGVVGMGAAVAAASAGAAAGGGGGGGWWWRWGSSGRSRSSWCRSCCWLGTSWPELDLEELSTRLHSGAILHQQLGDHPGSGGGHRHRGLVSLNFAEDLILRN